MSSFQGDIFIFDLHNTLYDEVLEYSGAMVAAIDFLCAHAEVNGMPFDRDLLYKQIARAHAVLGSDWDDDVWGYVPMLRNFPDFETVKQQVTELRLETSENLTKQYAFGEAVGVLRDLKDKGAQIYVATEATTNAAANAIHWLGLDGVVDGIYSWPYMKTSRALAHTKQQPFPPHPTREDLHLQKPHAYIIATIILDIAKEQGYILSDVIVEDVFDLDIDESIDASELLEHTPSENIQAAETVKAIQSRLLFQETEHEEILKDIHSRCFYIGDSFFKDGFLALNADMPFIHAAYGKVAEDARALQYANELMYQITGWEPYILKLTQEAGQLPSLTEKIMPFFTCENSLREFIDFLESERG